jgi:hypothetical protein
VWWRGSIPTFSAKRYTAFGNSRWLEQFARSEWPRSADLASEAAETLRSARGGGPASSGEAAVTADRREANERRCGGAVVRFAVDADCCGAVGCREKDDLLLVERDGDRRVLCVTHARGWME